LSQVGAAGLQVNQEDEMNPGTLKRMAAMIVMALLVCTASAGADEVLDEINDAISSYKSGDYSTAVSALEFAAQQIRQMQAGDLTKALPEPLPGWEADEAESAAMGGAMLGGAVAASREYHKGDSSVSVNITGESPALQAVLMMVENSMMLSMSGKKVKKIKSHKAIIEYDKGDKSGEITMVVKKSVMVSISGYDVSLEDMMAYAEALDFDLIVSFAEGS
jgi:hypothetical protein